MTETLAPLHIYIYTKHYRNFKAGSGQRVGGGWPAGGECLSGSELPVNH